MGNICIFLSGCRRILLKVGKEKEEESYLSLGEWVFKENCWVGWCYVDLTEGEVRGKGFWICD